MVGRSGVSALEAGAKVFGFVFSVYESLFHTGKSGQFQSHYKFLNREAYMNDLPWGFLNSIDDVEKYSKIFYDRAVAEGLGHWKLVKETRPHYYDFWLESPNDYFRLYPVDGGYVGIELNSHNHNNFIDDVFTRKDMSYQCFDSFSEAIATTVQLISTELKQLEQAINESILDLTQAPS